MSKRNLLLGIAVLIALLAFLMREGASAVSTASVNMGTVAMTRDMLAGADTGSADHWLDWALRADPDNSSAWRLKGRLEAYRGNWGKATAYFRQSQVPASYLVGMGEGERKGSRLDLALRWYGLALQLNPDYLETWYRIALVREERGDLHEALDAYRVALKGSTPTRCAASYRVGLIHYEAQSEFHDYDKALSAFRFAASDRCRSSNEREQIDRAHSAFWAGMIYRARGETLEAIRYYERALQIQPQHSDAAILLGVSNYEQSGDVRLAEAYILPVIERTPQYKWSYIHLGKVYMDACRFQDAKAMFEIVLHLDSQDHFARERLAEIEAGADCAAGN